ncbi:MAG: N,N-dimethylformamidase beta subunit family domain-containing protein, partial [Ilumatobacter sp.]
MDDQTFHDAIEGYCAQQSYRAGETVRVHVSTHAPTFDVRVERWGAEREEVWSTSAVEGVFHPPPVDADSDGCGWPAAVELVVDPAWRSGFHLVTLTAHGVPDDRSVAHACFVVRGPELVEDRRSILYVLPTNTWNAYNTWGGRSLYTGGSKVSFARPFGRGMLSRPEVERDDRKARPVRFRETPDVDGEIFQRYRTEHHYPSAIGSTGWFTHGRRFVEWAEGAGHAFDYAVTSDLDTDPGALDGYGLVLLVGHDEYWSAPARSALERHVTAGGNLASFSGNTMFWQVRLEDGERGPSMVCHKYRAHLDDPVMGTDDERAMSGMWADPVVARPEWMLLGGGSAFGLYHRFGNATARGVGGFVVYRGDHWLLAGTDLRYGDVLGRDDGVVGYETLGCPVAFD